MEVHLKYERGRWRKGGGESEVLLAHQSELLPSLQDRTGHRHNAHATVPVRDRVKEFSYKAAGGRRGSLFDGSERVVSIDSFHWVQSRVYAP